MKYVAVDCETASLEAAYDASVPLWCVGFVTHERKWVATSIKRARKNIDKLLKEGYQLVFHNAVFDLAVLGQRGIDIPIERVEDTQLICYELCLQDSKGYSLAKLAGLVGELKYDAPVFAEPSEQMYRYCIQDCRITLKLVEKYLPILKEDERAYNAYRNVEMPYVLTLIDMHKGCPVDEDKARKSYKYLQRRLSRYTKLLRNQKIVYEGNEMTCHYLPGTHVKYRKPEALGVYVMEYSRMKQKEVKKFAYTTSSGQGTYEHCTLRWYYPTNRFLTAEILQALGWVPAVYTDSGHPKLDKDILTDIDMRWVDVFRKYNEWNSNMRAFLEHIMEAKEGFVHPGFNNTVTRTKRLSSSKPNFQNLPSRNVEYARVIRGCIRAPQGYKIVCGDLDRIELVVLAHLLEEFGDSRLADKIREGLDVHTYHSELWSMPRTIAKRVIFLLIYGGGPNKLRSASREMGHPIDLTRAKEIFEQVHNTYKVEELRASLIHETIARNGVLYDCFGSRMYIPELFGPHDMKAAGERKVFNYKIQGTAATLFKRLQNKAREAQLPYRPILAVHDEFVCLAREAVAQDAADALTAIYTTVLGKVPVKAKFHIGDTWYDAKGD